MPIKCLSPETYFRIGLPGLTNQDYQSLLFTSTSWANLWKTHSSTIFKTLLELGHIVSILSVMKESLAIEAALSSERLHPYLVATAGSHTKALKLYAWNLRFCGALWGPISVIEVGLRNKISQSLSERFSEPESSWLESPALASLLDSRTFAIMQKAAKAPKKSEESNNPTSVASINFGFWTRLLMSDLEKALWVPYLHHEFEPGTDRQALLSASNQIRTLRNRIAHHEPIWKIDFQKTCNLFATALDAISPDVKAFVASFDESKRVWDEKPN